MAMRFSRKHFQAILAVSIAIPLLLCPTILLAQKGTLSAGNPALHAQAIESDGITPADLSGSRRRQSSNGTATARQTPLAAEDGIMGDGMLPALPGANHSVGGEDAPSLPPTAEKAAVPKVLQFPNYSDQVNQDTPWNALEYGAEASIANTRAKYPSNRPIQFVIKASWNGRPNEVLVDAPQNLTLLNLRQADAPTTKMHQGQDGKVAMFWTYRLHPIGEGSASIGPEILTATTRSGNRLPVVPLRQQKIIISQTQWGWGAWLSIALIALAVILLVLWALMIFASFLRKKRYQDAMHDSLPSLSERLLSEIDTLQVSLLQGSSIGYYEKIAQITRQLLRGRGLIGSANMPLQAIRNHLKSQGHSGPLSERALAILERCETAVHCNGNSEKEARETVAKDLRELILMQPSGMAKPRQEPEP